MQRSGHSTGARGIRQMTYGLCNVSSLRIGAGRRGNAGLGTGVTKPDETTELSAREAEVARHYVDGLSYKEIARMLEISPGTVRTHLNAIYRKLAVSSRTELARRLAPTAMPGVDPPTRSLPEHEKLEPENRQLTFLSAEIAGSADLVATLDPEDMHGLASSFRDAMEQVLNAFGGHLAWFSGTGALGVFGWPEAAEDAPDRAARAALKLASASVRSSDGPGQALKVGVSTGMSVVEAREGIPAEFVGAATSLAARLAAAAPAGAAVISALTRELVGGRFTTEPLTPSGAADPAPGFRILAERPHHTRFEARKGKGCLAPLLGRETELARLSALWKDAEDGRGGGVLLLGEAGIGKSRLAETLVVAAQEGRARVIRLQATEGREASALLPVRRAIAAASADHPDTPWEERRAAFNLWLEQWTRLGTLERTLVCHLLDLARDEELPAMSAARRRALLLDALAKILLDLAEKSPLLVLLEDLHWLDPSTLDLVTRLLQAAVSRPLLLLMTSREEGLPSFANDVRPTCVSLSPLGAADAETLVRDRAGDRMLDADVVAAIVARTDGIPLYVEETTSAVLDGATGADAVPATLLESLTARLDRLGGAKETAQVAAAIGRDVDLDLLSAIMEAHRVATDVDRLVNAGLAHRRRGGFIFSHALVQDAAYQSMLRSTRKALHGRIAEAMLGRFRRRFSAEPEVLADQLERAGRAAAAADYYLRASDSACVRAALREAEGYARNALALAEVLDAGPERDRREVSSLLALGRVRATVYGYGRAEAAAPLRRAMELCQAAGLRRTEFPVVVALTAYAGVSGDGQSALDFADRARFLADESKDPAHHVMASYAMGVARCWRGERRAAAEAFAAGEAAYGEGLHERLLSLGPSDPGLVCIARGAASRFLVSGDPLAAAAIDEAHARAERLSHAHSLNYTLTWKASQALDAMEWDRAEATIRETIDLAEAQDFPTWTTMGQLLTARFAAARLGAKEALEAAERAVELLPAGGNAACVSFAKGLVGDAMRRQGRYSEAICMIREAVEMAERCAVEWRLVDTLQALARCYLDSSGDDTSDVEATLWKAVKLARRQGAHLLELRAATDLAGLLAFNGERAAARELIETALGATGPAAPVTDRSRAEDILLATC